MDFVEEEFSFVIDLFRVSISSSRTFASSGNMRENIKESEKAMRVRKVVYSIINTRSERESVWGGNDCEGVFSVHG